MNHINNYKKFSVENSLESAFIDLKDLGFTIEVEDVICSALNFKDANKNELIYITSLELDSHRLENIEAIEVKISKKIGGINKTCKVSEVIDTLLFVESYCSELGLKIEYIFISSNWNYKYYKSLDKMTGAKLKLWHDGDFDSISITFSNKNGY